MDEAAAKKVVLEHVNARYSVTGDDLVIIDARTRSTPYGWVFFYNSRRYIETRDIMFALGGNGPVVFESETGAITELPSYSPFEDSIRNYETTRQAKKR